MRTGRQGGHSSSVVNAPQHLLGAGTDAEEQSPAGRAPSVERFRDARDISASTSARAIQGRPTARSHRQGPEQEVPRHPGESPVPPRMRTSISLTRLHPMPPLARSETQRDADSNRRNRRAHAQLAVVATACDSMPATKSIGAACMQRPRPRILRQYRGRSTRAW